MTAPDDGVGQLRKDHTALASTISVMTTEVGSIKTALAIATAVELEREKNRDERLDRIEDSIKGLYGLGKWMLLAFGTSMIAAIVTFVVRGGLNVPPPGT